MRSSLRRHLVLAPEARPKRGARGAVAEAAAAAAAPETLQRPDEMSWHDFAVYLLHIAAEIEHALLAQYLYAAYSLGGVTLDTRLHESARHWREIILGIAKEEMGHLITVQNILRVIGGPLHLEREDYPFDFTFSPFPFQLEPLTKNSLAKYVMAEAPEDFRNTKEGKPINARASKAAGGSTVNSVGVLYENLIQLFEDRDALKDDDFRTDTRPYQASWDEWGRGYHGGERGNQGGLTIDQAPYVLVIETPDRAGVLGALRAIANQGEAPETLTANEQVSAQPSHFKRFLSIYDKFPDRNPPSRNIPVNPTTAAGSSAITNEQSLPWAHLFNIRYRKLLFTLKHAFHVQQGATVDVPTARGNLIAWSFGEMYNLRAIAGVLVTLPLADPKSPKRAAPPFEVPYTLQMPDWDSDKWRVHRDVIAASNSLIDGMTSIATTDAAQQQYLRALRDQDDLALAVVNRLIEEPR
jgi:hypothetical protein